MPQSYTLDDLEYLMARLRKPETGCPWDIDQTFDSVVPHTLEEAYEVADAIERRDYGHLQDELGDLLFQVIFYAQLGLEDGLFDLGGIVDNLVTKLIRRHPHVFPEGTLESERPPGSTPPASDIKANWERIKTEERAGSPARVEDTSLLADIPAALPAMVRAEKIQRRAAGAGFDWESVGQVMAKLDEEKAEVEEALREGNHDAVEDEVGDLFFVCVNLARTLNINPEKALRRANRKFENRFRSMEQSLSASGGQFSSCDMAQLEALWQEAKRALAQAGPDAPHPSPSAGPLGSD